VEKKELRGRQRRKVAGYFKTLLVQDVRHVIGENHLKKTTAKSIYSFLRGVERCSSCMAGREEERVRAVQG